MDKNGLLLCARYSAAPNFFGYCGPDKSSTLIDHLKENSADSEVSNILSEFETLFPYLELIARKNNFIDPYDERAVEAYWLGNQHLLPVSEQEYTAFLTERLAIDKKINTSQFASIRESVDSKNFFPHHAFHVFNIFKRTGRDATFHTLRTMDECRIGWGKVKKIKQEDNDILIFAQHTPLSVNNNLLGLAQPEEKILRTDYKNKAFTDSIKPGDYISFHWGFVCDHLSQQQISNLKKYTQLAIDFYNDRKKNDEL